MRQDFATILYSTLPTELSAAIQWLERLGIAHSATRIGHYKETLEELESERLKGFNLYDTARRLNALAPLFEANELVTIHQGLAGKGLETYLLPRIKEFVSGPESYVDENAASANKARTSGFELSVIARLSKAGLIIQQDEGLADVVARLGSNTIIMECKRPQSKARISEMIRYAGKQLEARYRKLTAREVTGFIALDLTKVFNPDFIVTSDVALSEVVSRIKRGMDAFIAQHKHDWNCVRDERTAGVLLRQSVLVWTEPNRAITWVHRHGVTPFSGRSLAQVSTVMAVRSALDRLVFSEGTPIAV